MSEIIGDFIWMWLIGGWAGLVRWPIILLIGALIGVNNPKLMTYIKLISKAKAKRLADEIKQVF